MMVRFLNNFTIFVSDTYIEDNSISNTTRISQYLNIDEDDIAKA